MQSRAPASDARWALLLQQKELTLLAQHQHGSWLTGELTCSAVLHACVYLPVYIHKLKAGMCAGGGWHA